LGIEVLDIKIPYNIGDNWDAEQTNH
jgi:hypothetical protein